MKDRIQIDVTDHVAEVRLIRADKMNALDLPMFEALAEAGEVVRRTPGVRAVVLSGDGQAFCAGLDLGLFDSIAGGGAPMALVERTHGFANLFQHVVLQWRDLPVPVIAAVQGVAFGGGFQLMLGADMRFMRPDTRLSIMEIKWGIVPDMGGVWLTRNLLRPDVMAELTYTGRIFDGEEAARLGLATRLCDDPRASALEAARDIAAKSPDAIRAVKRLLSIADTALAERVLLAESLEQQALMGASNQREAVRAALEKRPAVFDD